MTNEADHPGATDPAQAFEDLRAEVSVLRRAMEALPGAWEDNQPPDYTPSLGNIAQALAGMDDRLAGIEAHPALQSTPAEHQRAVAEAGNTLMRDGVQKLDQAAQGADRERQRLAGMIGTARTHRSQCFWLLYAAVAGLTFGLIFSPLLASILPFGWDSAVAARIMNTDRWNAGWMLMEAGNPASWRMAVNGLTLVRVNQEALVACGEAAAKAKKEQHCMVTVPAP